MGYLITVVAIGSGVPKIQRRAKTVFSGFIFRSFFKFEWDGWARVRIIHILSPRGQIFYYNPKMFSNKFYIFFSEVMFYITTRIQIKKKK